MGDVIQFPKKNDIPQTFEEVDNLTCNYKLTHIYESVEILMQMIYHHMALLGFNNLDMSDEQVQKQEAMIVESIRSYLAMHHGINHPIQEVSSRMFRKDDEGILLDDTMNIVFRRKKTPKNEKTPIEN